MNLFLLTVTIALAALAAIEFGQAPIPRRLPVWDDDTERRYLRARDRPVERR